MGPREVLVVNVSIRILVVGHQCVDRYSHRRQQPSTAHDGQHTADDRIPPFDSLRLEKLARFELELSTSRFLPHRSEEHDNHAGHVRWQSQRCEPHPIIRRVEPNTRDGQATEK
jgi:hypothetical protein